MPLTVEAGMPVRISIHDRTAIAEGEVVLLNAFATDVYEHTFDTDENTSVGYMIPCRLSPTGLGKWTCG